MVVDMNKEIYDSNINEGIWILDFNSTHCGPCKILDAVLVDFFEEHPEINWGKCNIETDFNFELFQSLNLWGTPTLVVYVDGENKGTIMMKYTYEEVEEAISELIYA